MNLKLFYSPPWKAFMAPEKPVKPKDTFCLTFYMIDYEKAYAEAKANALEVGNWEIIQEMSGIGGESKDGIVYWTWKGSAVIKDGKYILSV